MLQWPYFLYALPHIPSSLFLLDPLTQANCWVHLPHVVLEHSPAATQLIHMYGISDSEKIMLVPYSVHILYHTS